MSYDFAVLTPEIAGADDQAALEAGARAFASDISPDQQVDPRLTAFLADIEASGAASVDDGWLSVWPLAASAEGLGLPTIYSSVGEHLTVLLRVAARHGLVLVDLNSQKVHWPGDGVPVGVMAGDGTRLGALTLERLESLLDALPASDPWLVLERDREVYVQTLRRNDGTYVLEFRDGSPDLHFATSLPDARGVLQRMWAWVTGEPGWKAGVEWSRAQL